MLINGGIVVYKDTREKKFGLKVPERYTLNDRLLLVMQKYTNIVLFQCYVRTLRFR